jgi:hypothetical protein
MVNIGRDTEMPDFDTRKFLGVSRDAAVKIQGDAATSWFQLIFRSQRGGSRATGRCATGDPLPELCAFVASTGSDRP